MSNVLFHATFIPNYPVISEGVVVGIVDLKSWNSSEGIEVVKGAISRVIASPYYTNPEIQTIRAVGLLEPVENYTYEDTLTDRKTGIVFNLIVVENGEY